MANPPPKTASSTDRAATPRVPNAWRLAEMPREIVTGFARAEGIDPRDERKMHAAIAARVDRREWVRSELRGCRPLDLVVLEVLAEHGGRVPIDLLAHLAQARIGAVSTVVDASFQRLTERLLAIPLQATFRGGKPVFVASLIEPSAGHVAALLRGVSLPPREPPADAKPPSRASSRRDVLAIAGLFAHRPVRFNNDGTPHSAQLGRFTKGLAGPDVSIPALIDHALHAELLGAIGESYAPIASALRAHTTDADARLDAWLPDEGWVTGEAITRAAFLARPIYLHESPFAAPLREWIENRDAVAHQILDAPGCEVREANGNTWIRRQTEASRLGGDGHVTPSFEVMLGPRADLDLVATIALGCELTRLDRVLTFKITPASVGAGIACGITGAELLGALDRVGRHPLPSNVRAMVEDWIKARASATLTRAWLVQVPEAVADAIALGDLRAKVLARPAKGVLAIDPRVRRGELIKALAKHRVSYGPPQSLDDALNDRSDERWERGDAVTPRRMGARRAPPVPPPPLPLHFEGDPALAEAVAAAITAGPGVGAAPPAAPRPAPIHAPLPPAPKPLPLSQPDLFDDLPLPGFDEDPAASAAWIVVDAMLDEAQALDLDDDQLGALESLGDMYVEQLHELERWIARIPPVARPNALSALKSPLVLAEFLVLAPKARVAVLGKANNLEHLLAESSRSRGFGRVSPRGYTSFPLVIDAARAIIARRAAAPNAPAIAAAEPSVPAIAAAEPSVPAIAAAEPSVPAIAAAEPSAPAIAAAEPSAPAIAAAEPSALPTATAAPRAPAEPAIAPERDAPSFSDFIDQPREIVMQTLRDACSRSAPLHLMVRSGSVPLLYTVIPSAIHPRGRSHALLAIDAETDEGRVFPVKDILGVLPAELPPHG